VLGLAAALSPSLVRLLVLVACVCVQELLVRSCGQPHWLDTADCFVVVVDSYAGQLHEGDVLALAQVDRERTQWHAVHWLHLIHQAFIKHTLCLAISNCLDQQLVPFQVLSSHV
jgi:hypothetical protein